MLQFHIPSMTARSLLRQKGLPTPPWSWSSQPQPSWTADGVDAFAAGLAGPPPDWQDLPPAPVGVHRGLASPPPPSFFILPCGVAAPLPPVGPPPLVGSQPLPPVGPPPPLGPPAFPPGVWEERLVGSSLVGSSSGSSWLLSSIWPGSSGSSAPVPVGSSAPVPVDSDPVGSSAPVPVETPPPAPPTLALPTADEDPWAGVTEEEHARAQAREPAYSRAVRQEHFEMCDARNRADAAEMQNQLAEMCRAVAAVGSDSIAHRRELHSVRLRPQWHRSATGIAAIGIAAIVAIVAASTAVASSFGRQLQRLQPL